MSPEGSKIESWQMTPEQRAECDVFGFEEMANVIYQAEAAKAYLDALKEEASVLTEDDKRRLLAACKIGMEINPKNSKEQLLFEQFKEKEIPRLFQSL